MGISGFSGFSTRDFREFSNSDSDPRDFGILEIFQMGVFRDFFELSNPDPRDFGIFGIFQSSPKLKILNPDPDRDPKKSHPEANSA